MGKRLSRNPSAVTVLPVLVIVLYTGIGKQPAQVRRNHRDEYVTSRRIGVLCLRYSYSRCNQSSLTHTIMVPSAVQCSAVRSMYSTCAVPFACCTGLGVLFSRRAQRHSSPVPAASGRSSPSPPLPSPAHLGACLTLHHVRATLLL